MKPLQQQIQQRPWLAWVLFLGTIASVFLVGLLTYTIVERRTEAQFVSAPRVPIHPLEPRPEVWGEAYPRQYDTYAQMADTNFVSQYGGARSIDALETNPRLAILFAGYGFAKNYRSPRAHAFAIEDVRQTLRTGAPMTPDEGPMPATCWTCKSSDTPRLFEALGTDAFYSQRWAAMGHEVVNPISCANCHDGTTMNLRINQPALVEAYQRLGRDVNASSLQDMRSLTCAQCHVEYYFADPGTRNYLTFPWDDGTRAEEIEQYFDDMNYRDWVHPISRTPMLKAQHPDYELFQHGIHSQRGVSCADCHMPYRVVGGVKYTDHRIQNPLANVANACQTCHRESEAELVRNVYDRQTAIYTVRRRLEDALAHAHIEAGFAWERGATEAQMQPVLQNIRRSQWYWDYIAASHGVGFHAPTEALRVLGLAQDHASEARLHTARVLASLGHDGPVPMPDLGNLAVVHNLIGVDVAAETQRKQQFLQTVVPNWLRQASERYQRWDADRAANPQGFVSAPLR